MTKSLAVPPPLRRGPFSVDGFVETSKICRFGTRCSSRVRLSSAPNVSKGRNNWISLDLTPPMWFVERDHESCRGETNGGGNDGARGGRRWQRVTQNGLLTSANPSRVFVQLLCARVQIRYEVDILGALSVDGLLERADQIVGQAHPFGGSGICSRSSLMCAFANECGFVIRSSMPGQQASTYLRNTSSREQCTQTRQGP